MSTARFKDEWLTRAVATLPGVSGESVEGLRAGGEPCLAKALLGRGMADWGALAAAVRRVHGVDALKDVPASIDRMALSLVPERICRRRRVLPLGLKDDAIDLAMENPLDVDAQADVQAVSGRRPTPRYCSPEQMDSLLARAFDQEFVVFDLVDRLEEAAAVEVLDAARGPDDGAVVKAPVIRLADSLIAKAVQLKASDIHVEHDERATVVRCRVDGVLKNVLSLPKYVGAGPLVARFKIMASLDVSNHLRPQDGRARLKVGGVEVGLRVSTLPTSHGEKVVLRILDKRAAQVPFEKLGFSPELAGRLAGLLGRAQGLILVTGPTGSGKTTTLYSMLNKIKDEGTNIVTVEDPIEYKLDGINQVQVQDKQGLTFPVVLRSVLRQDPDVILVGEIRDRETAEIAVQAAMTGHLVFSTLHSNDALSCLTRLADMGVERFKLAPSLAAVTAQRLVRVLCPSCRRVVAPERADPAVLDALRRQGLEPRYWEPKGCAECDFIGYRGRIAIVEFLEVTPTIQGLLNSGIDEAALRKAALRDGALSTLLQDALRHLGRGDTSLEEVLAYARPQDEPEAEAAPSRPRSTPAATPRSPEPAGAARRKALVADDDPTMRMLMRMILEQQGFAVAEAADGASALEALSAAPADLLIVDLHMPAVDGHAVVRKARAMPGLSDLPIVMLTADSDDASQEEALNAGADDYVLKPIKSTPCSGGAPRPERD
ncbi:MAG: type II/IV secretion system protein [Elusimicrobia bacterium]|nr:type II/IV secretion system protein [Elusimicrobiota bacterium]